MKSAISIFLLLTACSPSPSKNKISDDQDIVDGEETSAFPAVVTIALRDREGI